MKTEQLRQKNTEELTAMLVEHAEELRVLRFDLAMNKLKDVRKIRSTRRLIARIHTVLHEKQHAA